MMRVFLNFLALTLVWGVSFVASQAQSPRVYPIPGTGFGPMSPVVGDHDGVASNGLEIVLTTLDGTVQMLSGTGAVLWSVNTPNSSCALAGSGDRLYSSAVVGDLFGNGERYVVVGYGGYRGKECDGGVAAYKAKTGELAWVFSIKAFAKRERFFAFRHAVYATPTLADVDRDGDLEIGFGSFDRNVYLLNSDGSVRWYYHAADTVFSSPSFLDVGGDGALEMIIGTDISRNPRLRPPTQDGGYLYALRAGINKPAGTKFGFRSGELQLWRTSFNQVMQSGAALGELIPDNPGLEVVVGSGCFFPQKRGARRGKWYKVLSARNGRVLRTLAVGACTPSAPAVGDVDGDGVAEVVVTASGDERPGRDGPSRLIAWKPASNQVLWNIHPSLEGRTDALGGQYRRTPTVVDLNRDGRVEVLINYRNGVVIVDGVSGTQLSCDSSRCSKPLLKVDSTLQGSPVVADLDGDGVSEVIVAGRADGVNGVVVWSGVL
jgi:hypothetical protein